MFTKQPGLATVTQLRTRMTPVPGHPACAHHQVEKKTPVKPRTKITVELTDEQAVALAHYLKRYVWTDVVQSAVNDEEGYLIWDAFDAMQYALTDAGFTPP